MSPLPDTLTLGGSLGLVIWFVLMGIIAVVGMICFTIWRDDEDAIGLGLILVVFQIVTVAGGTAAYYPFDGEYHHWKSQIGVVEENTSRMMSENKGTTQYSVLSLDTGFVGRCDDGRCLTAKTGDMIHLRCKREWQYEGEDGWDCRFQALTRKKG